MNINQLILVLYSSQEEPEAVKQLTKSIIRLGSTTQTQSMFDLQYDKVLDAVATADTVIYWPQEKD